MATTEKSLVHIVNMIIAAFDLLTVMSYKILCAHELLLKVCCSQQRREVHLTFFAYM